VHKRKGRRCPKENEVVIAVYFKRAFIERPLERTAATEKGGGSRQKNDSGKKGQKETYQKVRATCRSWKPSQEQTTLSASQYENRFARKRKVWERVKYRAKWTSCGVLQSRNNANFGLGVKATKTFAPLKWGINRRRSGQHLSTGLKKGSKTGSNGERYGSSWGISVKKGRRVPEFLVVLYRGKGGKPKEEKRCVAVGLALSHLRTKAFFWGASS